MATPLDIPLCMATGPLGCAAIVFVPPLALAIGGVALQARLKRAEGNEKLPMEARFLLRGFSEARREQVFTLSPFQIAQDYLLGNVPTWNAGVPQRIGVGSTSIASQTLTPATTAPRHFDDDDCGPSQRSLHHIYGDMLEVHFESRVPHRSQEKLRTELLTLEREWECAPGGRIRRLLAAARAEITHAIRHHGF